jgi:hypothetical protein
MDHGTQALKKPHRDGAGFYRILVSGLVSHRWETELQMQLDHVQTALGVTTTLSGELSDQSALLGVLNRLAMWNYLILEVQYESALDLEEAPSGGESPC